MVKMSTIKFYLEIHKCLAFIAIGLATENKNDYIVMPKIMLSSFFFNLSFKKM